MNKNIYSDIAQRTGGDIYIGVVGPVRTGKSTLIKRFMDTLVLPNIENEFKKERALDELPQSAAGKTIMTTEPKFVPEEAVEIKLPGGINFKVRMIDCVGYIVPSAIGYAEGENPRMVITPWYENEIPFDLAAEIGTKKVISEHSTIGLVVTTDGSISDIDRFEYEEAEERVIAELKAIDKPYVILLNSREPQSGSVLALATELAEKYHAPVLPVNCSEIDENTIKSILSQILFEFPIKEVAIDMPSWLIGLSKDHWLKSAIYDAIKTSAENLVHIRDVTSLANEIDNCEYVSASKVDGIELGVGGAKVSIVLKEGLFYKVLAETTGLEITNEQDLLASITEMAAIKKEYARISDALEQVEREGYGIVMPTIDELILQEPEIMRQGGKYGVRLKASAPSIHMLKADITTEVAPLVGSESQSEELVKYLLSEFENKPEEIWTSNIFGKSLHELVNEGLHNKLYRMPSDARGKLQETIEKIINEGCSGLICIIL